LKLVLPLLHLDPTAVKTHAPQRFEGDVDESLVVDGTCQFDVTEVSGVGFVVEVPEAGIVDASVDWLTCHVGLVGGGVDVVGWD